MSDFATLIASGVIGLCSSGLVAFAVWLVNVRASTDIEARELHKDLTSGAGGEAREKLSGAEYMWWSHGELAFDGTGEEFRCTDPDLFEAFYRVSASVDRLNLVMAQYHPTRSCRVYRRSVRYRQLLGWHLAIHIAWIVWFIGAASSVRPIDAEPGWRVIVPPRLEGQSRRIQLVVNSVGGFRTGERSNDPSARTNVENATVKQFAERELSFWTMQADTVSTAMAERANAVRLFASTCGLSVGEDQGPHY